MAEVFPEFIADAEDIATGFKDEMQASISGFKSASGIGGFKGVSLEIRGVIVVAAEIESEFEETEAREEPIIDGGGSTNVGELPSSSKPFCIVALIRLLLNWHFFDVM